MRSGTRQIESKGKVGAEVPPKDAVYPTVWRAWHDIAEGMDPDGAAELLRKRFYLGELGFVVAHPAVKLDVDMDGYPIVYSELRSIALARGVSTGFWSPGVLEVLAYGQKKQADEARQGSEAGVQDLPPPVDLRELRSPSPSHFDSAFSLDKLRLSHSKAT